MQLVKFCKMSLPLFQESDNLCYFIYFDYCRWHKYATINIKSLYSSFQIQNITPLICSDFKPMQNTIMKTIITEVIIVACSPIPFLKFNRQHENVISLFSVGKV